MKTRLAVLLLAVATALGIAGCKTPAVPTAITTVQLFETGVQAALSTAEVVWVGIAPLLPSTTVAQAQPLFDAAVVVVNDALGALNDAITVAEQTQNPSPDFSALSTAVTDALQKVLAIIDQFRGSVIPPGYDSFKARVASLQVSAIRLSPAKAP
jgi:hypothetical protein